MTVQDSTLNINQSDADMSESSTKWSIKCRTMSCWAHVENNTYVIKTNKKWLLKVKNSKKENRKWVSALNSINQGDQG